MHNLKFFEAVLNRCFQILGNGRHILELKMRLLRLHMWGPDSIVKALYYKQGGWQKGMTDKALSSQQKDLITCNEFLKGRNEQTVSLRSRPSGERSPTLGTWGCTCVNFSFVLTSFCVNHSVLVVQVYVLHMTTYWMENQISLIAGPKMDLSIKP